MKISRDFPTKRLASAAVMIALLLGTASAAEEKKHVWMTEGGERNLALELEGNAEDGLEVYEVCSACHLPEGWGTKDGTFPQIAGQHKNVIIKQMADIREGNRDNPTMYPFALPESIGGRTGIGRRSRIYGAPENESGQR